MSKRKSTRKLENAFKALDGRILRRQHRTPGQVEQHGPGFIYFTDSNSRLKTDYAEILIREEAVTAIADGLFEGQSQSFEPTSSKEFERLKDRYVAL